MGNFVVTNKTEGQFDNVEVHVDYGQYTQCVRSGQVLALMYADNLKGHILELGNVLSQTVIKRVHVKHLSNFITLTVVRAGCVLQKTQHKVGEEFTTSPLTKGGDNQFTFDNDTIRKMLDCTSGVCHVNMCKRFGHHYGPRQPGLQHPDPYPLGQQTHFVNKDGPVGGSTVDPIYRTGIKPVQTLGLYDNTYKFDQDVQPNGGTARMQTL